MEVSQEYRSRLSDEGRWEKDQNVGVYLDDVIAVLVLYQFLCVL